MGQRGKGLFKILLCVAAKVCVPQYCWFRIGFLTCYQEKKIPAHLV